MTFFIFLFSTVSSLKKFKNWSHRGEHILCFYQGLKLQLKAKRWRWQHFTAFIIKVPSPSLFTEPQRVNQNEGGWYLRCTLKSGRLQNSCKRHPFLIEINKQITKFTKLKYKLEWTTIYLSICSCLVVISTHHFKNWTGIKVRQKGIFLYISKTPEQ